MARMVFGAGEGGETESMDPLQQAKGEAYVRENCCTQ